MGKNRTWSQEAKLAILEEAERNGIAQTGRKHGVAASQIHEWKKKRDLYGDASLSGYQRQEDPELQQLRAENQALKELLAEKELTLRIKDSLLNRTEQRLRSGS